MQERPYTKRQEFEILRAQLNNEISSFKPHWQDLADHINPRRLRFTVTDVNRGDKRNQKIVDSTPTMANRTLQSGMMSGLTSPARPWFRLAVPSEELAENSAVKLWLHQVTNLMVTAFIKSNLYNTLPIIYGDLGCFGTAAMFVEEDFENVIHTSALPIGSYMCSVNERGIVDTLYREFQMTVRNLVKRFGKPGPGGKIDMSMFSQEVRDAWDRAQYETWVQVAHVMRPNPDYDPRRLQAKYKRFQACYYERGFNGSFDVYKDNNTYLSESGYDYFPALVPRWEVTGEDTYATNCPGMTALGDIKQLMHGERKSAQALDKMVDPPMVGPTSLRNSKVTGLPGGVTYNDVPRDQGGLRPAYEVQFRVDMMEQKQQQIRDRIRRAFFEDLFLMLANDQRSGVTAREIDERHEEKLLAIGPVLERMNQDLLDPLIDLTFNYMVAQGRIPEPPEELNGMDLKVEYISIMAQAQKMVGIGSIERYTGFVTNVAGAIPQVMTKLNANKLVDTYAELTSVPPGINRSDEEANAIIEAQQQAAAQQARMEQISQASQAAKNLAGADMEGDNALNRLVEQAQAGAPAAVA